MTKVRINDLAREMEVKSKSILDALIAVGVTEKKTHSSSIEEDEAEKVRGYFNRSSAPKAGAPRPAAKEPAFSLAHVSKPGDALKAILERKQAEAAAKAAPPPARPPVAVAAAPGVARTVTAAAPPAAPKAEPPAVAAPRSIVPQTVRPPA